VGKKEVGMWDIVFLLCTEIMNLVCGVRSRRFLIQCSTTMRDVCEGDVDGEKGGGKISCVIFGWWENMESDIGGA
jgi:hypothetical protein